jgi:hypothetical protein
MVGGRLAVEGTVHDEPGPDRRGRPQAGQHLVPHPGQVPLGDDAVEVAPQLAQDQVVGVEPALRLVEQVVGLGVDQGRGPLVDGLRLRRRERADVGPDPVQRDEEVVGPPVEHGLAAGEPLVVAPEVVVGAAVLALRARLHRRAGPLEDPDVARVVQAARGGLEIRVPLARAAPAAEAIAQLRREPAERDHDPGLERRHVVQEVARQEARVVSHPVVQVHLAVQEQPGHVHRPTRRLRHLDPGGEVRVVVDLVHVDRAAEVVEHRRRDQRRREPQQPREAPRRVGLRPQQRVDVHRRRLGASRLRGCVHVGPPASRRSQAPR